MNDKPRFILIGGELLNVQIIGRAAPEPNGDLRIEFIGGGFTSLRDVTVEDLAETIGKL